MRSVRLRRDVVVGVLLCAVGCSPSVENRPADDEIALDAGVVRNDGSVDGKLLLANLVKRSLLNGDADERAIGAQMRQQIAALAPAAPEYGRRPPRYR